MALPVGTTEVLTPRKLFALGYDSADNARHFHIREAEALKILTVDRSAALGLPDPYPRQN